MTTGYIYKITNSINGKVYIGQTIQSVKDRWYRHCSNAKCLSKQEKDMHIKRAILKYGKENFSVEILEECEEKLLNARERYYICYYNSYENGYNSTPGGQDGVKPLQTSEADQKDIVELYKFGFSLCSIAKEFNIDKKTVKGVLAKHNIPLRTTKTYKFCQEMRQEIIDTINLGVSRKEVMQRYKISKGYLSQLISGDRRI